MRCGWPRASTTGCVGGEEIAELVGDWALHRSSARVRPAIMAGPLQRPVELAAQHFSNKTLRTNETVDLVCDEKEEFSARVGRRVRELQEAARPLAGVTFDRSESAVGLQMADLVAYEMRKALTAVILNDGARGIRDRWMRLMNARMPGGQPRIYATFWDEAAMRRGKLPPGLVSCDGRAQSPHFCVVQRAA